MSIEDQFLSLFNFQPLYSVFRLCIRDFNFLHNYDFGGQFLVEWGTLKR